MKVLFFEPDGHLSYYIRLVAWNYNFRPAEQVYLANKN